MIGFDGDSVEKVRQSCCDSTVPFPFDSSRWRGEKRSLRFGRTDAVVLGWDPVLMSYFLLMPCQSRPSWTVCAGRHCRAIWLMTSRRKRSCSHECAVLPMPFDGPDIVPSPRIMCSSDLLRRDVMRHNALYTLISLESHVVHAPRSRSTRSAGAKGHGSPPRPRVRRQWDQ